MKKLVYFMLGGFLLSWAFKRGLRGIRDLVLLCMVIAYSGAHWPSSHGLARVGASFKAGYDRGVIEHNAREQTHQ
jgi:hypothetical protein